MGNVKYCIPSYKRAEKQETLAFLRSMGVPAEDIFIFVQTEDDHISYENRYGSLCNIVFVPAEGVAEARNNILEFFGDRENILMMDDDVSSFAVGSKGKKFVEIQAAQFESVVKRMFDINAQLHGRMFGMYPVWNEFFMSNDISTKVTVNTVLGFPKGFSLRFNEKYKAKEDIELCGRILSSGGRVVRFNNIAYKAKHRTNPGGAYDAWHSDINKRLSSELELIYPDVFSVKSNNPNEVRLVKRDEKKGGVRWI